LDPAAGNIFAKFVIERQDTDKMEASRLASWAEIPAEPWTQEILLREDNSGKSKKKPPDDETARDTKIPQHLPSGGGVAGEMLG
jgi:hypothetical protein